MKLSGQTSRNSAGSPLANFLRVTFVAMVFFAAAGSLPAAEVTNAYANWIKPWMEQPVTSPTLAGAGLKLIVRNVRGEAAAAATVAMTPVQRIYLSYHIKVAATEVATNGNFRSYFLSNTYAESGDVRQLAPKDFQQLDQLLAKLPEDNSQLPPAGNRLVLQVLEDGQWRVRVYDGSNLPPEVKAVTNLLAPPAGKTL